MTLPLFVYGTLKRSSKGTPHRLLRQARFLTRASISGTLYDLGAYPGVFRKSRRGTRVFGELFELPSEATRGALKSLDKYEGREFLRRRVFVVVRGGRRRAAWAYVLRRRPGGDVRLQASGRYASRRGAT